MRFPPSSASLPSPTARTLPRWGFSLAVSGRTMPLAVVSSSSIALTISRSPRGLSFIYNLRQQFAFGTLRARVPLGTLATRVPSEACDAALQLVLPGAASPESLGNLRWPVRYLREADDGDGVLHLDLSAVDLLQEVHHLLEAAELGVVVLDIAR